MKWALLVWASMSIGFLLGFGTAALLRANDDE